MAVDFSGGGFYRPTISDAAELSENYSVCGFAICDSYTGTYMCLWSRDNSNTVYDGVYVHTPGDGSHHLVHEESGGGYLMSGFQPTIGVPFFWGLRRNNAGGMTGAQMYGCDLDAASMSSGVGAVWGGDSPDRHIWIGNDGFSEPFHGKIWGVKVWSGALLTDAEFDRERRTIRPQRFADLAHWWPMIGDTIALCLTDYSGNGRNLTEFAGGAAVADGGYVPWGASPILVPRSVTTGGPTEEEGVGAASVGFSATATGRAIKNAAGAASTSFGAAATGRAVKRAAGAASFAFGASGTGQAKKPAAGSASFAFGASGTGQSQAKAAGSASVAVAAAATGRARAKAAGSASIEFVPVGIAASPQGSGAGAAAVAFDAQATGRTIARAVGTASLAFAGDAVSREKIKSYAVGEAAIGFAAAAVGEDANAPPPPAPAPAPAPAGHPTGYRVAVRIDGRLYLGSYAEIAKIIADKAEDDARQGSQVEANSRTAAKREARRFAATLRQRVAVEEPMPVPGFDAKVVSDRMFRDLRDVYARQMVDALIANRQVHEALALERAALEEQQRIEQEMIIKQRRKQADEKAAMAAAELLLMN